MQLKAIRLTGKKSSSIDRLDAKSAYNVVKMGRRSSPVCPSTAYNEIPPEILLKLLTSLVTHRPRACRYRPGSLQNC